MTSLALMPKLVPQRVLGNTGIKVSCLGLGSVKMGRNQALKYPTAFTLPSDEQLIDLLDCAQQCGINLIDTAPAYGCAQQRLGHLLQSTRQQWILSSKVGEAFENGVSHYDFSASFLCRQLEQSLRDLQTDQLDILLIHSNGDDLSILQKEGALHTLQQCQRQGMTRYIGFSGKTVAGGLLALEQGADIVMVMHNPHYQSERAVMMAAHSMQRGVLIKKALLSGHLPQSSHPIADCLATSLSIDAVSSVIVGTLNPQHLYEMAHIACNLAELNRC